MTVTPSLLVVSNVQCRLGESDGGTLIKFQRVTFGVASAAPMASAANGWDGILDRTRRSAEAHSLISRYFSF
jgi:hypothetical protein